MPDALTDKWAYHPADGERLGIYLTNALEEAHEMTGLPLFTQWVADESNAANDVKVYLPVLIVMGNPPYSYESINTGKWISKLVRDYYYVDNKPLNERNPKGLQDDYVKFIRFGQWRIQQTESGILAFITNHGYLSNPTFRGMRQSLLETFEELYILDLHGSTKRHEKAPDNGKEENVFDIQAGVAVAIFVKSPKHKQDKPEAGKIYHADLYGDRRSKYDWLSSMALETTNWTELNPQSPFYLFIPQQVDVWEEYEQGCKITEIWGTYSVGISTSRDKIAIQWTAEDISQIVNDFAGLPVEEAREKYNLGNDTRDWKIALAQEDLKQSGLVSSHISEILYRIFDNRYTYYTGRSRGFQSRPRPGVSQHMILGENLMLCTNRQVNNVFRHIFVSRRIIDGNAVSLASRERTYGFPLFLYPAEAAATQKSLIDTSLWPPDEANSGRVPNFNPAFVTKITQKLNLEFTPDADGDLKATFGAENIFHYIYAIFHSQTYRARYKEFLKIDFPRVPLTSSVNVFQRLCALGKKLVELHLLESPDVGHFITRYPIAGENRIEKGYPKYALPKDEKPGRININTTQYIEGVSPEVWKIYIGGYQVLQKWLKDRRGRQLSYDDLTHVQKVVVALQKTLEVMEKIDEAIPEWPIQ